ncbi:MAG TPA: hypothetical protein VN758_08350 [Solirubrobacterales bacterium]|nr:hypothetical protein [Solirubrobacterales bacterium]
MKMRKRSSLISVLLSLAAMAAIASPAHAGFGLSSFDGSNVDALGDPVTQAGSHPYEAGAGIVFNTIPSPPGYPPEAPVVPDEDIKDISVNLPPGQLGNPNAVPICTTAAFNSSGNACPKETRAGTAVAQIGDQTPFSTFTEPIYNLEPEFGEAAKFGFKVAGVTIIIDATLSSAPPYHVILHFANIPQIKIIFSSSVTFWGVPSDHGSGAPAKPFVSMPTSCEGPLRSDIGVRSWLSSTDSSFFLTHGPGGPEDLLPMTGCAALEFEPTLEARPTTNVADSPSGLDVDLHVPQNEDPAGTATAHLRDTTITLPEGLVANPAQANGLGACSPAQANLNGEGPAHCPDAAKLATVEVDTPLVDHPVPGAIYLATPHENPFNSLIAVYLTLEDPKTATVVKLAGEVQANPNTGRLTASFKDNPQVPFEDFKVHFKSGPHGALRTPPTCAPYTTTSSMTPWSAPDSGPPATPADAWSIERGPGGGCAASLAALPNAPAFDAGTVSPQAGKYSPFVVHLRREDGSQNFSALKLSPPPGLIAKLAGTATCSEAALAAAAAKSGKQEQANPSCPAASRVGSVVAGAGAGPAPYYAPGTAYLTGPYKGAPLSLAIISPAVAGPFDLGTIVVRTALAVDPKTAQVSAISDPIPSILDGIPLDVRSIDVSLDRTEFMLNPTSCDPSTVSGSLTSTLGQVAPLSSRFQLGECGRLPFKPKMTLALKGGTKRGSHPALNVTLTPRPGDANIASLSVALPHSEFLDQAHIGTVCTRVQFAADACPAGAVYGTTQVSTPLLAYPLTGNLLLRSSTNKLPDLVADLRGPPSYPLHFEAAGRTDSIHGGIRNTFDFVPDAPFAKLTAQLQGAGKGLLVNSRDICAKPYRATVKYTAHNGLTYTEHPLLKAKCPKARKAKAKAKGKGAKRRAG